MTEWTERCATSPWKASGSGPRSGPSEWGTRRGPAAYLLGKGVARRKLPEQLVRWDGPLPRTAFGKIIRSRLVMESPGKDSGLAPRLLPGKTDKEGTLAS
jgi:hypothetical protein